VATGTAQTGAATQTSEPATPQLSPTIASLSAQIIQQAGQKSSRFDVQLTPEGLGRVDVAVQIDSQGNVTASLSFEKPDSAALVKDESGALQSALASAGLSLDSLKIDHVQADGPPSLGVSAQQSVSAGRSSSDAGAQFGGEAGSQSGGQSGQHSPGGGGSASLASGGQLGGQTGGQSGGQTGGQSGQQNGPSGSALALRTFQATASAADGADLQASYASNLSSRGLDIRI
jgi:hypothetical protein